MTTEQDIQKFYNCPNVRLTVVAEDNFSKINSTDDKIVLFNANWSGPSRMHISAVLHKLNALNLIGHSVFYIDIDIIDPEKLKQILGKQSHGNGEAVVITSGQMTARYTGGDLKPFLNYLCETFQTNTAANSK